MFEAGQGCRPNDRLFLVRRQAADFAFVLPTNPVVAYSANTGPRVTIAIAFPAKIHIQNGITDFP